MNPPKIVRKASDHRHTGITTYYGINFENPKSVKSSFNATFNAETTIFLKVL